MDWGLLQPKSKNFLLRDDVVFYKWVSIIYGGDTYTKNSIDILFSYTHQCGIEICLDSQHGSITIV